MNKNSDVFPRYEASEVTPSFLCSLCRIFEQQGTYLMTNIMKSSTCGLGLKYYQQV